MESFDINTNYTNLSDYKPYQYLIPSIEINFSVFESFVKVKTLMNVIPLMEDFNSKLILKGSEIELESIKVNDKKLPESSYEINNEELIIEICEKCEFSLLITSKINPYINSSLEGLYLSEGMLVTQCEAEGFRRIVFHPDRPDVLSKYKVSIEADLDKYPILLSNGNCISSETYSNRHKVVWVDPFPKPSYLFALVAGNLQKVSSSFLTKSGKKVLIHIYVESGDEIYTKHAISSLKKAMIWDEKVYGLEYDLEEFNIVAVRHFNMGAMENKSLNIFNSKLVLADESTATDEELERIESVIAHEYFHNWTGNRITCRDWFQLSLKEGLTVFRDQSFTSDTHSADLKRIEDVCFLRNTQFKEDSGPTAHPVKPTQYLSIDNFYTTTIYEKGAELIRMLYVMLGKEKFMLGIAKYIERFDGKYATTEDFVKAIEDGASLIDTELGFNMEQFYLWYRNSGTPNILVKRELDLDSGNLILKFIQSNSNNDDIEKKDPMVIPILLAEIACNGKVYKEKLFILNKPSDYLVLRSDQSKKHMPLISLFRRFSSPVTWEADYKDEEYLDLIKFDNDPFSRWDADQNLMRKAILSRTNGVVNIELESGLIDTLQDIVLSTKEKDSIVISKLLSVPGFSELETYLDRYDPISLYNSRNSFISFLGKKLAHPLKSLLDRSRLDSSLNWPKGQKARRNISICWSLLAAGGDIEVLTEVLFAVTSNSMTLAKSALFALRPIDCSEREIAMHQFYAKWKNKPVILDSWFGLSASIPINNSLSKVNQLLNHPRFDSRSPNAIRAVLGGLALNVPLFHSQDGAGYEFMFNQLIDLDNKNPITASRICKVFTKWKSYKNPYKEKILNVLNRLEKEKLSSNTKEVVDLLIN